MKIGLLLTDISNDGGAQKAATNLVSQLHDEKIQFTIISVFNSNKSDKYIKKLDGMCDIKYLFDYTFNFKRYPLKLINALRHDFNDNDYDYIICVGIFYSTFVFFADSKRKIKKIAWNHTSYKSAKTLGLDWVGRYISIITFNHIIAITKRDYNHFKRNMLTCDKKLSHIYNFSEYYTHRYYRVEEKEKYILSIGTLGLTKGTDYIIDIAIKLRDKYPQWKWYVVGAGTLSTDLKKKYIDNNLNNFLIFTGYVENPEEYYQNAEIFALTSRSEGFGYVVLEAKMYSLPVISFSCDKIINEIINHDIDGVIIDDGDIQEYTNRLDILMKKESNRSHLNYHTSKSHFVDSVIKSKWLEVLDM